MWQINATTNGMSTLPVCSIGDLNYWTYFYKSGNHSYNDYCICYSDINDNAPHGPNFKDYAIGDLEKFRCSLREGECEKGRGAEMAIGASPVGLAPRASGHPDYKPLPWP